MFSSSIITLLMTTLVAAAPGIILIGDSTVTNDAGWGRGFCADTTGLARCVNLAVSGTTTISWQTKPQQATMVNTCKNADTFATIQFGHNDQITMNTTTFATNLESLVRKVRAAGCSPILVTSLTRRNFAGNTLTDNLGPYAAQTISVARKLNLPLLPLLANSMDYVRKLGRDRAMTFNFRAKDTTHLNAMGSTYFGRMVADEVRRTVPALASHIIQNGTLSAKIAAGTL